MAYIQGIFDSYLFTFAVLENMNPIMKKYESVETRLIFLIEKFHQKVYM